MLRYVIVFFIVAFTLAACRSLPADTQPAAAVQPDKSAFGIAFDEIVVESSLTVKRKSGNSRQAKTNPISNNSKSEQPIRTRRNLSDRR